MSVPAPAAAPAPFAEDIRLIIWDLDETFWDGTLTEGGIRYRADHHALVIALAKRGIMSAICSKNDRDTIETLLREKGIWDYLIFPSIDWTPKGPRIKAMLTQIGLRPESVLFIDDNRLNLAQAVQMNPGLNVALPSIIPDLAAMPQLTGKADPAFTRLAQYRVKERKADAAASAGEDQQEFLRASNIRVRLEYDVERHMDRAIELINRTNQLNFTKTRLPDDLYKARAALSAQLAHNTTDAALIEVRDAYGDYGFAGFYLTERVNNQHRLKHFCFSCRTLNMFIEHWTYAHLGRPTMPIVGAVLTNPTENLVGLDWVTPVTTFEPAAQSRPTPLHFDRIIARGGCDLASLMHYFRMHADILIEEFNCPKNGQMFRRDHSSFLMPALEGPLSREARNAAAALGYEAADFETEVFQRSDGSTLYLLSFWADADIPVYRDEISGLEVPYWLVGAQNHDLIQRSELREVVARTDIQRIRLAHLAENFSHQGLLSTAQMQQRYAAILDALPADAPVVLVLANERGPRHFSDSDMDGHPHHRRLNTALRDVAQGRDNVILLDPAAHINGPSDLIDLNHFKRPIYHRMYQTLHDLLTAQAERQRSDPEDV